MHNKLILFCWCFSPSIFFNLQHWSHFVRTVDPDIITGYNIQNFDFPYLLNRASHLKVINFPFLGRIRHIKSVIKESTIQSKQMGKRENKIINLEGRVMFDLLQVSEQSLLDILIVVSSLVFCHVLILASSLVGCGVLISASPLMCCSVLVSASPLICCDMLRSRIVSFY